MLHEILLGLCGHSGNVIDLHSGSAKFSRLLVPEIVSEPEAKSIEELLQVGVLAQELQLMVNRQRSQKRLVNIAFNTSLSEILDMYYKNICEMEKYVLSEPNTPISQLRFMLADWQKILEVVLEIAEEIERSGLFGGQILDYLHIKKTRCGVGPLLNILIHIEHTCNTVLFNMIQTWMTFGILVDAEHEFFVQERNYNVFVPLDEDNVHEYTAEQHPLIAEYEWKSQFRLRSDMVPSSFFSHELAEYVLFVGKSVRILQRSKCDFLDSALGSTVDQFLEKFQTAKETVPLNISQLTQTIQDWYEFIAFEIRKLVVEQGALIDHLHFVRDFYLLGRGEFFASFISLGRELMSRNPKNSLIQAEAAVNAGPWREAATQSGVDDWDTFTQDAFNKLRVHLTRSSIHFGDGFNKGATFGGGGLADSILNTSRASSLVTTPKSGESSSMSNLVLVGDTHLHEGTINIKKGGVWYGHKLLLERGFDLSLQYQLGADPYPTKLEVVFQHDPSVGPTALFDCENRLACVAEFSARRDFVKLSVQHDTETLLSGSNDPIQLIDDQAPCTMLIKYRSEVGTSTVSMVLEISIVDSASQVVATLKGSVNIQKTLHLERVAGRAWIGICHRPHEHSDTTLDIGSWTYVATQPTSADPWLSLMDLKMYVSWPLHLVLTQYCLDQYAMMFRFILGLKRVENELKEAWALLNQTRYKRTRHGPVHRKLMQVWKLRASMAFLVNNLQFHFQVDVIDALRSDMTSTIKDAKYFSVVERAHSKFVENVVSRSFLHNQVIRKALEDVLRQCMKFCHLIFRFHDQFVEENIEMELISNSIDEVSKDFHRVSMFLYTVLARVNSNLLLRLDYNEYFSKFTRKSS